MDEARRVIRMKSGKDYNDGRIRFPLVDDFMMRRHQSVQLVKDFGWPEPPRSNCWCCPNQNDNEWSGLTAEELKMAIKLENELREKDPDVFLHKSRKPLSEVVFTKNSDPHDCDSGECFL